MVLALLFLVGIVGMYALLKTNGWPDANTNPLRWSLCVMVILSAAAAFFHHLGY